jgi:hypothetical protein
VISGIVRVNVTKGVNKVSTVLGDAPITPAPGESSKGATATRRDRAMMRGTSGYRFPGGSRRGIW